MNRVDFTLAGPPGSMLALNNNMLAATLILLLIVILVSLDSSGGATLASEDTRPEHPLGGHGSAPDLVSVVALAFQRLFHPEKVSDGDCCAWSSDIF